MEVGGPSGSPQWRTEDQRLPYWKTLAEDLSGKLSSTNEMLNAARQQIVTLGNELVTTRSALARSQQKHRLDIELIGCRALKEANDNEWCELFDEVVADLNKKLTVQLPTRDVEWQVDVMVRMTISTRERDDAGNSVMEDVKQAIAAAGLEADIVLDDINEAD